MKSIAFLLVSFWSVASTLAVGAVETSDSPETTIIVIDSMEPGQTFQVAPETQVRIPATAIAGTAITAQVSGPAEIVARNRIVPMKENTGPNGVKTLEPLLGTTEYEFLLQPTGAGEVTVTLTAPSPIPRDEPVVKKYRFTVK
jgi:hypothetical protein